MWLYETFRALSALSTETPRGNRCDPKGKSTTETTPSFTLLSKP